MADAGTEVVRRMEGKRLTYYIRRSHVDFWDEHWRERLSKEVCGSAAEGNLGIYEEPFTRYLPRKGRILEAGCGAGQYVVALRKRGYTCEGVDLSAKTVETVRTLCPGLPVRSGDVTALDVRGGTYHAYVSLGVIEHRREGPEPFLKEAYRVLTEKGVMLVSVPFIHRLRALKARLGFYRGQVKDHVFYQYAFAEGEMRFILEKMNFRVIDTFRYSSLKGIKDEVPIVAQALKSSRLRFFLGRICQGRNWMDRYFGHMILFVCKKAV